VDKLSHFHTVPISFFAWNNTFGIHSLVIIELCKFNTPITHFINSMTMYTLDTYFRTEKVPCLLVFDLRIDHVILILVICSSSDINQNFDDQNILLLFRMSSYIILLH